MIAIVVRVIVLLKYVYKVRIDIIVRIDEKYCKLYALMKRVSIVDSSMKCYNFILIKLAKG